MRSSDPAQPGTYGHALSRDAILAEKARIEELHGKWTAHNTPLRDGVYTIEPAPCWAHHRGRYVGLSSEVLLRKSLSDTRILDIGWLEGGIALALGEAGARVVGVEIREANLAKAEFARSVLGLSNVEFVKGDMLRLDDYDLGVFDVIVCAGTLYQVDAPDLLPFLRTLRSRCSGFAVFDTHFSTELREDFVSPESGHRYYGRTFVETHHATADPGEKEMDLWGSLSNDLSFWPTVRSLVNLLVDAGFAFVVEPRVPVMEWPWRVRGFWVAYPEIGGLLSSPYPYATGRLEEPVTRPPHHELMDSELQRQARNPATRLLGDGALAPGS